MIAFPRLVEVPAPSDAPAADATAVEPSRAERVAVVDVPVPEVARAPVPSPSIVEMFARTTPAAPPAKPLDVAGLRRHLEGGALRPEPNENWGPKLAALLLRIQPTDDSVRALERLEVSIRASDEWTAFPAGIRRALLGLHGAWLRALQDGGVPDREVTGLFSTLTTYSKREQPGVVHGLARFHVSQGASWAEDADQIRGELESIVEDLDVDPPSAERLLEAIAATAVEVDRAPTPETANAMRTKLARAIREALAAGVRARDVRLVRLAAPHVGALVAPEFKALRKAIRVAAEEDEEEPADADGSPLPADWAWWPKTRGRHAIMVGGSPRELNRVRLERAFEFGELEWMPAEFRRNSLLAVRKRVLAGSVDVVLILRRFVGHDADDIIIPACKERGVDWVHVEHGYGVARLRQGIERFLRT